MHEEIRHGKALYLTFFIQMSSSPFVNDIDRVKYLDSNMRYIARQYGIKILKHKKFNLFLEYQIMCDINDANMHRSYLKAVKYLLEEHTFIKGSSINVRDEAWRL